MLLSFGILLRCIHFLKGLEWPVTLDRLIHYRSSCTQALRLFLVWDSEGIQESEDRVLQQIFESVENETDSESEGDKKKKGGKKNRKRSRSGRSSVTSRASSKDSSSEARR